MAKNKNIIKQVSKFLPKTRKQNFLKKLTKLFSKLFSFVIIAGFLLSTLSAFLLTFVGH